MSFSLDYGTSYGAVSAVAECSVNIVGHVLVVLSSHGSMLGTLTRHPASFQERER